MAGSLQQDLSRSTGSRSLGHRAMDGFHARLARFGRPATAFVSTPEPTSFGDPARGRQLLAGNHLINGEVITAPGVSLWEIAENAPGRDALLLHDFKWLDDLAALGGPAAQGLAQTALGEWIARYGTGRGPGWTPDLTARRMMRWISHAVMLLGGEGSRLSPGFFRSLGQQGVFLSRRWKTAASGRARFEALAGMIYAGMSLRGLEGRVDAAAAALDRACAAEIDGQGGLASRNPEDMLEVLLLLTWAADALEERGRSPSVEQVRAIARIAPSLRALRHGDGGLVRCHGGGRGAAEQVAQALARTGIVETSDATLVMGYARLAAGSTTVILDAAVPPRGAGALSAHASTLAFEMTSGRFPIVINCGSGASFGAEWRRAGRATASHSTLGIDGTSSSRLEPRARRRGQEEALLDVPTRVTVEAFDTSPHLRGLLLTHNGYDPTHGLTHARQVQLRADGRMLEGTDTLAALEPGARLRCDRAMTAAGGAGLAFTVRFHLAPEVEAQVDMGGTAVSLLPGGDEVWIFRARGARMALAPSVALERGRLKPRATRQIVLTGRLLDYATELDWSFTRVS